jgi:hypothetical protein
MQAGKAAKFSEQELGLGAVRVMTTLWRIYRGRSWLYCLISTIGHCGDFEKAIEGLQGVLESVPLLDFIEDFFYGIVEHPSMSVTPVGLQCVTWLVNEKGVRLGEAGVADSRVLRCATQTCSVELVQHLLDLGVDVNIVPSELHCWPVTAITAAACDFREGEQGMAMIKFLLEAGADLSLEARVGGGQSTLFYALSSWILPKARLLVQHGARLEPSDHCE